MTNSSCHCVNNIVTVFKAYACDSIIVCRAVQTVIVSKTVARLSVAQMHATGVTEAVCVIFDPGLGTLSTSLAPFISCQRMFWRRCGKNAL